MPEMPGSKIPSGYEGSTDEVLRMLGILMANRRKNFVGRALAPSENPYLDLSNGVRATHLMSWAGDDGRGIAYPNVVQQPPRRGLDLLSASDALRYAQRTGEYIPFRRGSDADEFSRRYKAIWPYERKR
jgi:hypothetical protein